MIWSYDPVGRELTIEDAAGDWSTQVAELVIRYLGDGGVLAVTMTPAGIDLAFVPIEEEPGRATLIPVAPGRWRLAIAPVSEPGGDDGLQDR